MKTELLAEETASMRREERVGRRGHRIGRGSPPQPGEGRDRARRSSGPWSSQKPRQRRASWNTGRMM